MVPFAEKHHLGHYAALPAATRSYCVYLKAALSMETSSYQINYLEAQLVVSQQYVLYKLTVIFLLFSYLVFVTSMSRKLYDKILLSLNSYGGQSIWDSLEQKIRKLQVLSRDDSMMVTTLVLSLFDCETKR